jgi:hypothetical protein
VVARADMESADRAAPIDTSGKREAAGRVIGVKRGGDDPVCHDGRSISTQGSGWGGSGARRVQAGCTNAVRVSFLFRRAAPYGSPSRSVA